MRLDRMMRDRRAWWVVSAIIAGTLIGIVDRSATEVQGPLLLIMVAAFALSLPGAIPPWLAGLSVTLSLTAVHAAGWLSGTEDNTGLGSIIAVVPALMAAYGGCLTGLLIERAAESLPYGRAISRGPDLERNLPWYAERSGSRSLLAAILCGCAIIGLPVAYQALLAAGQPITWWVATIWQVVALMMWVALTPVVIRRRGTPGEAPNADAIATMGIQILLIAGLHSVGIVVLTRLMMIPQGDSGIAAHMAHAFAAYLPLDLVTFVLLRGLAYVSDADRHLREAANESAIAAATATAELNAGRLTALRAQLRPHFLFNAINAAVMLARSGDARGAAAVLTSLADLLRYVLSDKSETVPLADEIEFTERYLEVERARFPDRLRYSIEASDEAGSTLVPHLLLQPLVENAVRHGIAANISGGEIRVRAGTRDRLLEISIEDDGPGIGSENQVSTSGREEAANGHGVGLANTRSRLSLMYGSAAELSVVTRPGGGTVCQVTLPLQPG